jgi:hypothetical protein
MTDRSKAELDEMRCRMQAAQDKPADIDHFFRALECQPEEEADILWEAADRRLTQFENLGSAVHEWRNTKRPLSRKAFIRRHNRRLARRRQTQ